MLIRFNLFNTLRKPQYFHSSPCISYREDYVRLGVPEHATKEEIKAAYFEKAKLLHPDANDKCKIEGSDFFELNEAYKRLMYESRHGAGSYDTTDPRNDPRTSEYWDIRRRRQTKEEFSFEEAFNNRGREKERMLIRRAMIAMALGVFFGTIFPAIFVGSDSQDYYRTGCECDSCILDKIRKNPTMVHIVRSERRSPSPGCSKS